LQLRHLRNIQQWNEWRPHRLCEPWVRPYRDPLAFYAFWACRIDWGCGRCRVGGETYAALKGLELQRQQGMRFQMQLRMTQGNGVLSPHS